MLKMAVYKPVLIHSGIKDMRWGVRRYRNYDGTLTEAGKKRYAREVEKNTRKPKDQQVKDPEALINPEGWAKQDYESTSNVSRSAKNVANALSELERSVGRKKQNQRLDLNDKSDKELREKINRELLERQYNDVFNAPKTNKGREACKKFLAGAGAALGVAAAITSMAVDIHILRHG